MSTLMNSSNVADAPRVRERRKRDASTTKTVSLAILLTTAAATLWMFGFAISASIIEEIVGRPDRPSEYRHLIFRDDGLPVWKKTDYRKGQEWAEYHDLDGQPVKMTVKQEHPQMMTLVDSRLWRHSRRATWANRVTPAGTYRGANPDGASSWCFHHDGERGHFVGRIATKRQVSGYIGKKGFSRELPPREDQFVTSANGERHELVGRHNQFDNRAATVGLPFMQLINGFTVAATLDTLLTEPGGRRVFAIDLQRGVSLLIHDGEPVLATNVMLPLTADENVKAVLRMSDSVRIVPLTKDGAGEATVIPIPESLRRVGALQWIKTKVGHTFVTPLERGWRMTMLDGESKLLGTRDVVNSQLATDKPNPIALTLGVLASQLPAIADVFMTGMIAEVGYGRNIDASRVRELGLEWPAQAELSRPDVILPLSLLHLSAIVWAVLAVRRLRRYSASSGDQWFWGVWTLLFGAPGYLAFRAHREWRLIPADAEVWHDAPRRESGELRNHELENPTSTHHAGFQTHDAERRATMRTAGALLASAYGKLLDAGELCGASIAGRIGFSPSHTALVLKEFRLTTGIALLASLAYVVVLARLMGLKGLGIISGWVSTTTSVPFVHDGFAEPFLVVGVSLAVWLAVWQTMAESRGEAWLFMLHRPVSRRAIVLSKLLIGLLAIMSCTAMPILVYAAWASRPGSVAAPFEWSMTELAWRDWAALTPIYLGTLLTMLRPARWFGTRLLPVIAVFGWLASRDSLGAWLWPVWWELLAVLAINTCLTSSLFLTVREREYP